MAQLPAQLPFLLGTGTGLGIDEDGLVVLPGGLLPGAVDFDPLEGGRVSDYRFELLSSDETPIGTLLSVEPGGYIEWHAYAAVKGAGSITVRDLGDEIDWLNVRIKPWITLGGVVGGAGEQTIPLGIFLPAAPVEEWSATGRSWGVELADKNSILDQDIVTDADGNPISYTAPAGSNVITLVKAIIADAGESSAAIGSGDKALPNDLVWEAGTTRLKIVNDLLEAADFFSLWVDGQGQYRTSDFVPLQDRTVVYEASTPFSKGDFSLMSPDWSRDRDIYSVPNRYVAISQGSGETEAWTAVATNESPESPFSYPRRGRWVTRVVTGVEATSEADLQSYARRGLAQASSITSGIKVSHLFLPDMLVGSIVKFLNPDAGLDMKCHVTVTRVPFDPVALCGSELREVVSE